VWAKSTFSPQKRTMRSVRLVRKAEERERVGATIVCGLIAARARSEMQSTEIMLWFYQGHFRREKPLKLDVLLNNRWGDNVHV